MLNGKVLIVHLIAGLIKKNYLNKCDFSCIKNEPKLYELFGRNINVKVYLSNYATKTSSLALKSNLTSFKTEVDKLDIDKFAPVPDDLSKLSDVAKNDVVKKIVHDKLVAKANSMDTIRFVLKTKYDTDKSETENKIPDTSGLVKKTDYNAKITEKEGKTPSISGLATKTALTAVENKIPNINSLVKKIDHFQKKLLKPKRNLLTTGLGMTHRQ